MSNLSFSPDLLLQGIALVDCLAVGGKSDVDEYCIECRNICQRPENPCIVDIDYEICETGVFEFIPELTAFSLDTTNGINGTWHMLQAVETDSKHTGNEFEAKVPRFQGHFVADLCDHISGFFSEPNVCFRLTIRRRQDASSPVASSTTGPYTGPVGAIPGGFRLPI